MTSNFNVQLATSVWRSLRQEIHALDPLEHGAFLLAWLEGNVLRIEERVEEPEDAWVFRETHRLKPTTDFLNAAAATAHSKDMIPVFLHSHPMGWAEFSGTDEHAHEGWAPFFMTQNPHHAFASLVYGMEAWTASLWTATGRLNTREVYVDD